VGKIHLRLQSCNLYLEDCNIMLNKIIKKVKQQDICKLICNNSSRERCKDQLIEA